MVGSIDRYFQIARCYRDEATRPDRQPEFTQLDVELSFTTREKIMQLIEATLVHCWPEANGTLTTPFREMTYQEAMENYGSDKPDLRFDLKLRNITNLVGLNGALVKDQKEFGAYAIPLKIPEAIVPNAVSLFHSFIDFLIILKIPDPKQDQGAEQRPERTSRGKPSDKLHNRRVDHWPTQQTFIRSGHKISGCRSSTHSSGSLDYGIRQQGRCSDFDGSSSFDVAGRF